MSRPETIRREAERLRFAIDRGWALSPKDFQAARFLGLAPAPRPPRGNP